MQLVKLTDTDGKEVRFNAAWIHYIRADREGNGTIICLGGTGKDRLMIHVKETPEEIEAHLERADGVLPLVRRRRLAPNV
jgi:hypothetical protein